MQVYGDAAVLTHRTTVNTQENNQPVTFQLRSMHVFVKKGEVAGRLQPRHAHRATIDCSAASLTQPGSATTSLTDPGCHATNVTDTGSGAAASISQPCCYAAGRIQTDVSRLTSEGVGTGKLKRPQHSIFPYDIRVASKV